ISSPNCFRTAAAALQLRRHSSGMRSTATMVATATTPSRTLFSPIVRLVRPHSSSSSYPHSPS
uniref:Uncharacterized protein n=1 Tax=Aegilops tauschii subsp. strangulata TaxID=200361 RepID=A0A453N6I9_AEGTS